MIDIFEALCNSVPRWNLLSFEDIRINPLFGGLTNKIYLAEVRKSSLPKLNDNSGVPTKAIIRIFGKSVVNQKHRSDEKILYDLLVSKKIIPPYFLDFKDGRIEQFLQGRNPTLSEMNSIPIQTKIIEKIAQFHKVRNLAEISVPKSKANFITSKLSQFLEAISSSLDGSVSRPINKTETQSIPQEIDSSHKPNHYTKKISKTSEANHSKKIRNRKSITATKMAKNKNSVVAEKQSFSAAHSDNNPLTNFNSPLKHDVAMRERIASDIQFNHNDPKKRPSRIKFQNVPSLMEFQAELKWISDRIEKTDRVVLCHNDVQRGNIMLEETPLRVQLIDFEYSDENFAAFDLGNLLCECYIENFSDEGNSFEIRRELFPVGEVIQRVAETYLKAMGEERASTVRLVKEIKLGILSSHLFWSLWALVTESSTNIKWCYKEYGVERLGEYFRLKRYWGEEFSE